MKQLIFFLMTVLLMSIIQAQNIRISGTVSAYPGNKMITGASLTLRGTRIATLSADDGSFSLLAPKGHTVIVSHVGFATQEISVDTLGSTPVQVILLENALTMAGVTVSNGYEHLQKIHTTGSYTKIDNELFNRSTGTSILSRLDGVASSVLFDHRKGSDAALQIRGISSLGYASTAPLVILDNFPYEDDINNINPGDVESITILKDAAAASIWGARAGNGVIVITTKKGKFNQPVKVSFNTDLVVTPKPDLFAQNNMSTSDFIEVEQFLFSKGYYNVSLNNRRTHPAVSPVVDILARQKAGTISDADAEIQLDALRSLDVRNDFEKYLYRTGTLQQYGLNISGGSKTYNYLLSGGYDKNVSNLVGNKNDRYTIRSANSYIPFNNLELDVSIGYTRSEADNNSPGGYNDIRIVRPGAALYPYAQLADEAGNPLPINNYYRGSFTDTAGAGILLDWKYRPLDELNAVKRNVITTAFIADVGLKYNFSKAFNEEVKYQYQNSQGTGANNYTINSFATRDLINKFTQYDGANLSYAVPYGGILDGANTTFKSYGVRGQLNFNKTIHAKHYINAIAGAEIRQDANSSVSSRAYGYNDQLNFAYVDNVNAYPTFDNVAGNTTIPGGSYFSGLLDRYVSAYANASYAYNRLYTFSASFRKDASNLFGVKSNDKGVPLWSAGAAWNISDEAFYHSRLVPYLKLRITYGYSGNVSHTVSALTTLSYRSAISQPVTNVPFDLISNYPNPQSFMGAGGGIEFWC